MEKNVGGYDRIARLIVGPVLIIVGGAAIGGLFALAAGTLGLVLAAGALVVGTVLTVTGLTQKCPLNSVIGMNTYKPGTADQSSTEDAKATPK